MFILPLPDLSLKFEERGSDTVDASLVKAAYLRRCSSILNRVVTVRNDLDRLLKVLGLARMLHFRCRNQVAPTVFVLVRHGVVRVVG